MTFTLAELIYEAASQMDVVTEGTATGGSTNTIIDTNDRNEAESTWLGGTAVITYDAGALGAAPQWEYGVISAFTDIGNIITLRSALTQAVVAGDKYAIWKKRYPLNLMIQSVNKALRYLGKIPIIDITTIETAGNKTEYTLPGAATLDLRKVWFQARTGDSDDNDWSEIKGFDTQLTGTGTASKLITPYQLPAGHDLKLLYVSYHQKMTAYNSQLSEFVHMNRVIYRAAYYALKYKNKDDDLISQKMAELDAKDIEMQAKHPIVIPKKSRPGLQLFDDNSNYDFGLE